MKEIIKNINKIVSFKPEADLSFYELSDIEGKIISDFNILVEKLEKLEQKNKLFICLRGNSKKNDIEHNNFITNDLSKVFIVGEKAKFHLKESNKKYKHYAEENIKDKILKELKQIIFVCNDVIKNKSSLHNVYGIIPNTFIKYIEDLNIDILRHWQNFFISFLHNSGKLSFKKDSPFISLTYGTNKFEIAKRFALHFQNHKTFTDYKNTKGFIYLYCLKKDSPYYIKTIDLISELKKHNINWYEDIHNEIMLLNGMYPHFLIGIFEISNDNKFILNPWLYQQLLNNKSLNYRKGIKINQRHFHAFAKQLGYDSWFYHFCDEPNNEYVVDVDKFSTEKKVNKFNENKNSV